jgi:hypothetical protein
MSDGRMTRRRLLGGSAAAVAFTIVPRGVLGGPARTPPSERRGYAVMGLGRGAGAGRGGDCLAVCDPDRERIARVMEGAPPDKKAYTDFRYALDRKDIDEVRVYTPPHWHALISILAAQAGKDVFCEKPLTRTIAEGRAFVEAIQRYGVAFRYGAHSEGTPPDYVSRAVHSGLLGHPLTIYQTQALGCSFKTAGWTGMVNQVPQPVPSHFDWDMYCGPAPMKPYHPHRTHGSFRGYWDYDGGGLTDMAPHILNAITPAMGKDHTSPVEVEAEAPPPDEDAVGIWYTCRLKYDDGTALVLDSGCKPNAPAAGQEGDRHTYLEGPKGRLYFAGGRRGVPATDPPWLLDALRGVQPPRSLSRLDGLPSSIRTVVHAHRTISIANLTNISVRTGRPVRFDPVKEEVVGDDEANRLVNVPMRAPWHLYL